MRSVLSCFRADESATTYIYIPHPHHALGVEFLDFELRARGSEDVVAQPEFHI